MLINWLTKKEAEFIISEATGGLEIPALLSMHEAGFLVARVNARWIKNFGRAQGQYAKTALIAVIRKVVVMLNAMVKKNTLWDDKMDFGQRCL